MGDQRQDCTSRILHVQPVTYHKPPFLVLGDPSRNVEVWAPNEHRLGLKPILCRVWAPKGQQPIALGYHRYRWLYVTAFVQPISGETVWSISNGVSKPFFAALLALFAQGRGAVYVKVNLIP